MATHASLVFHGLPFRVFTTIGSAASQYVGEGDLDVVKWAHRRKEFVRDKAEIIDAFLIALTNNFTGPFLILCEFDAFSGHVLFFYKNPDSTLIYRRLSRDPGQAQSAVQALERFENGQSDKEEA